MDQRYSSRSGFRLNGRFIGLDNGQCHASLTTNSYMTSNGLRFDSTQIQNIVVEIIWSEGNQFESISGSTK